MQATPGWSTQCLLDQNQIAKEGILFETTMKKKAR